MIQKNLSEYTKRSNDFIDFYKPYMFQNWNKKLRELTFPFLSVKIVESEYEAFCHTNIDEMPLTISKIDMAHKLIGTEYFFAKYFTRSPKDYPGELKFNNGYDFIYSCMGSLRVFEDFVMTYRTDYKDLINFYIRPFVNIPKQNEFRAFKIGAIISITQYHNIYNSKWFENPELLKQSIVDFVNLINKNFELDDFCCDLFVNDDLEIKLIEINPYQFSDPIFFNNHENLNGKMILVNQ